MANLFQQLDHKIPIPSNKSLVQSLEPSFHRITQLNEEIREADQEYE